MLPPLPAVLSRVATKWKPPGPISRWVIGTTVFMHPGILLSLKEGNLAPCDCTWICRTPSQRNKRGTERQCFHNIYVWNLKKKQRSKEQNRGCQGLGKKDGAHEHQSFSWAVRVSSETHCTTWWLSLATVSPALERCSLLAGKNKDNDVELWTW